MAMHDSIVSAVPPKGGTMMKALPAHGRFAYSPIVGRPRHDWPNGGRLALYIGFNVEHFAFGEGLGARLAPPAAGVDVLNHAWREYGNRVGAWRCLELFESLGLPLAAVVNAAVCDHAPALMEAFVRRGDEIVAHGHSNAEAQGAMGEADERALLLHCRERLQRATGQAPAGWLSPWISESALTPDLLVETGYRYTLNWCHDDQPTVLATRAGPLWAVPYPQEVNDIPMIVARGMSGSDFADLVVDHFDEMLEQSADGPLVMGIALHPYLVGQPHRLRPLRKALRHLAAAEGTWWTTPRRICDAVERPTAASA
jgi:peptidoglycan/xylan/chitin deacetylase (PgdA/CDA1 family)